MHHQFPPGVAEQLDYYVYLYVDPRDNRPFYVGQGTGNRVFAHLKDTTESEKVARLDDLRAKGIEPRIDVLKWGLDKEQALLVESAAIDLLGIDHLTNCVQDHVIIGHRRTNLNDVILDHVGGEAVFDESAVLIKINRNYDPEPIELYDATRSSWKISPNKRQPKFAMAAYGGVIREVYEIQAWLPGGTTMQKLDRTSRSTRIARSSSAALPKTPSARGTAAAACRTCRAARTRSATSVL